MASVNKVILLGNLGADPEIRSTASGEAICSLRLATTDKRKDKQTGETRDDTEWHRVVLYRRLAEIARDYLRKGSSVYVEGRLRTRKWQDKDGRDRYTTEIECSEMLMLGAKTGGTEPRRQESDPVPKAAESTAGKSPVDDDYDYPF